MEASQSVTTFNISAKAYQTFQGSSKQSLKIAFYLIFLPSLLSAIFLRPFGAQAVSSATGMAAMLRAPYPSMEEFLASVSSFYLIFLVAKILSAALAMVALFALTHIAVQRWSGDQSLSTKEALSSGLKSVFFKGFALSMAVFFVGLERYFWGPFPIFSMFALMAPTILIYEGRGISASFFRALLVKYPHPANASGFSVALTLVLFGAMLFFAQSLVELIGLFILRLDEFLGVPRGLWMLEFPGLKLSLMQFLTIIVESAALSAIFVSIPFFMCCLYFSVIPKLSQRV